MIRKLRRKFVLVATFSVALILVLIVASINIYNLKSLNERVDTTISCITDNNGVLPRPGRNENAPHKQEELSREARFDSSFFTVYFEDDKIIQADIGNLYSITAQAATDYALEIISSNKKSGIIDEYKYKVTTINDKDAIVFVDISKDLQMFYSSLKSSILVSLLSLCLMLFFSYVLSPLAIKPIVSAYEKQKKFITNASHEIKTPLTIISANMDILEMQNESKWITSSRELIERLTDLVNSLLVLSHIEEDEQLHKTEVSLSELSEMVAESYAGIALAKGKEFRIEIDKDVIVKGDEKALSQLFYILLDNAFKYSSSNGYIDFSLKRNGSRAILTVSNSVEGIRQGNHKEYFDRFYRNDESRNSETGGFGIGLSLAKSIVEKHKGKIIARSDDEHSFTIQVTI